MKLHHVICQKTAIFVPDHGETPRTREFFRDLFMVYLRACFCIHLSTPSLPVRIDSEQINFDEVPLVNTKLSLCLASTT